MTHEQLETADRYNLEHIARLEIENQSICLQHRMQERRERQIQSEHETLVNKMAAQRQLVRDADAARLELERLVRVQSLSTEETISYDVASYDSCVCRSRR